MKKFKSGNARFVEAKRSIYRYMAGYHAGMDAFTTLITVVLWLQGPVLWQTESLRRGSCYLSSLYQQFYGAGYKACEFYRTVPEWIQWL